ncbi:DUF3971 domain-containing protein [Ferruginivarius sediminum]|uniref:YhdP central domain-containing protein n=1 Tax=Ferruginivarius sediminum TaxID=2661937 RepID=A0A369T9N6_9PROT|nr:AsmA-like C-terminal region-containing protein [Ferruginivarius sediminum]RDD60887.1 hypothetical protein DRB17_15610 [Ferruginivarius sediminum]
MIRRSTKIALEAIVGVAALATIVTGVLFWRLSQGPVELDFLTPRLQAALSDAEEGVSVELGGTVLAWEGWPETVALRVTDVAVRSDTETLARVPALDLKLSFPALVAGTLAPTEIVARGARLTVVRDAKGFRFGPPVDAEPGEAGDVSDILPDVLADLMAAPRPERRLSYLETVRIAGASLAVRDEILDVVWWAPTANIALRREAFGIAGTADMRVRLGGDLVTASSSLQYRAAERRIGILADVRNLKPSALAASVPQLSDVAGISVPLAGTLGTSFDLSGRIGNISANLQGDQGEIAWPGYLPEPVPVRAVSASARLDRAADKLTLETLELNFGTPEDAGPTIRATATADALSGDIRVSGETSIENVAVNDLARYWPHGVGGNSRAWVTENIRAGKADVTGMRYDVRLSEGDPAAAELLELGGNIAFSGLDVHYLRPMPPVTNVGGTATFDADSFNLDVASGRRDSLEVTGARVEITGLDGTDHWIAIDLDVRGPLRDALETLDHPRLDLMEPLGIDPATTSGEADTNAVFRFPLLAELTMDEVEVEANARLERVEAENFLLGQDARGGAFDLRVDKSGMNLKGPVSLGALPLHLDWRENFEEAADYRSEIAAQIPRITPADLERLGLEARPFLDGPVSANLRARTDAEGSGFVKAALNLRDASMALPTLAWQKPPGDAGEARLDLRLKAGKPMGLRRFSLEAGGDMSSQLGTHGSVEFGEDGASVKGIRLDTFTLSNTRLNKVAAQRSEGVWTISVEGGAFDADPLLKRLDTERNGEQRNASGDPGPPVRIRDVRLARLRFGDGRYLSDVDLAAERGPDGWWRQLYLEASVPEQFAAIPNGDGELPADAAGTGPTRLFLSYAPRPDGRRAVRITAGDTGAALRAMDMADTLEGGRLTVEGLSRGIDPASPIDASIDLRKFKIARAPALAKLLTLASLTGISDVLQGKGIGFQRFYGDVVVEGSVMSTDFVHAYGPALGITAKGHLDVKRDTSDLRGTIVPAASVNRVLGKIPVLGSLLTGGKGEGVFAVTYSLSGPLQDPDIDVNPLSALAPGFLRGLFDLSAGSGGTDSEPPRALPPQSGR